ncbi:SAM-dependent methyltransferase [Nocardia sp. NPDC057455]|uniref:SAM-dependent methyltransferase n=1 Tax=Nocardia sp. NPDC057455 TaxID=3346138 RepID=UPI00366F071A
MPGDLPPVPGACAPVGPDPTRPSIARVHDYSLGGKDNYEVDRRFFHDILQVAPRMREVSSMTRLWLDRVVRHLVGDVGIDQIVDLGAGLPAVTNIHEIAHQYNREARVVYVDNDPLCCTHGRALLERHAGVRYVQGDLTRPRSLLPEITGHLEPGHPMTVILSGVLHHVPDELGPAGIVRAYAEMLPPGSYFAISHYLDPTDDSAAHRLARELEHRFVDGLGSGWFRTREQIAAYFDGLELVGPGLVELGDWWPYGPALRPRSVEQRLMLGALGRIPILRTR